MRHAVPISPGWSTGLGTLLFPWAKAWIAADELDASLDQFDWWRSQRDYGALFPSSRLRTVGRTLSHLGRNTVTFTFEDYLATGERRYRDALRVFADQNGLRERSSFSLRCEGMWGGWYAIEEARDFVESVLLGSNGTVANLLRLRTRLDPNKLHVAVHVRRDDFDTVGREGDYQGRWNAAIPIEWYREVCHALSDHFGDALQFIVVGSPGDPETDSFAREIGAVQTTDMLRADCSDLIACSTADLLVCSVSGYSLWAAFLSTKPYIWFAPQLTPVDGTLTLWGGDHGEEALLPGSTLFNVATVNGDPHGVPTGRGVPVGWDAKLPAWLLADLEQRAVLKRDATDLVMSGAVPAAPHESRPEHG